jgi:hypothetical protein
LAFYNINGRYRKTQTSEGTLEKSTRDPYSSFQGQLSLALTVAVWCNDSRCGKLLVGIQNNIMYFHTSVAEQNFRLPSRVQCLLLQQITKPSVSISLGLIESMGSDTGITISSGSVIVGWNRWEVHTGKSGNRGRPSTDGVNY